MLYSSTMALSKNMAKNKDFILTLDLCEKWDKTILKVHLISSSSARNFDDKNSLMFCLFTESTGKDILVSNFGNDLSTSTISIKELEAAEVQVFAKYRLLSRIINSFLYASCAFNVKQWLPYPFGKLSTSAIVNNTDYFLWIRRVHWVSLVNVTKSVVSSGSERPVSSCHWLLYCFLAHCILFSNV